METISNSMNWFKNSISFKLITIGFIAILLLIPSSMVKDVVSEREQRRNETLQEVYSKWGNPQHICGPVVSIPYIVSNPAGSKIEGSIEYAHFMPEKLEINCDLVPETRYRGIFKVNVYKAKIKAKGSYSGFDFSSFDIPNANIKWEEAFFSVGIPDTRGIVNRIKIKWNENEYFTSPGVKSKDVLASGISTKIPVEQTANAVFDFEMEVNGSESLSFIPVGKETNVKITSNWKTPSFDGAFLPKYKEVDNNGFKAEWNILEVNLNYPDRWTGSQYAINLPLISVGKSNPNKSEKINTIAFGVRLLDPVDFYQLSMRSVKYAILFILLTFISLFFVEIITGKKFHPVQYLLTGSALVVFYTLLLSLSEHIGFFYAYILSSVAIILMVMLYTRSAFKTWKPSFAVTGILSVLYLYLYIILQLSDYALLAGSIGLFVILGFVMYFSKKIDWYNAGFQKNETK